MRLLAASTFALLCASGAAHAACTGAANGTPETYSALASDFRDNQPAGSIVPGCMRDLLASTFGAASNNVNLRNLGLPTGGDDTTAINAALASALPASFTGTGSISGSVLTVTGTPGGVIAIGDAVAGTNVPANEVIISLGSGTGAAGTYNLGQSATAGSTTVTFQPPATVAVYAPAGVYKHAGDVIVNGVCLYGDGPATNIRSSNLTGTNPTNAVILTGVNPCLRNLSVTSAWSGSRQTNGDSSGIWVGDDAHGPASGFLVEGVKVTNAASAGVEIYQSNSGVIRDNWVYGTLADGISHGGGNSFASYDNLVEGNYISSTGDDGISVDTYTASVMIRNIRIIGNHVYNAVARGISVNGALSVTVSDNVVESPGAQGYQAGSDSGQASTTDVMMSGNLCVQCGVGGTTSAFFSWGQSGFPAAHITWANNVATSTTYHCFQLGDGTNFLSDVTVIGNTCSAGASSLGYGVALFGVTAPTIVGNTFVGFEEGVSFPGNGGDAGPIVVSANHFDGLNNGAGGGNYAVDLSGETFASAVITSNTQRNDGTTISGMLTISGIADASIFANSGDNNTYSVSGVTQGIFSNPYGTTTYFGSTAPIALPSITTGTPTTYACFTSAGVLVKSSTAC